MGPTTRRIAFLFLLFLMGTPPGWGRTPEPIRRVTLRVYDNTGVPDSTLRRAEEELRRMFAWLDVGMDWVLCYRGGLVLDSTCNLDARPSEFYFNIVERRPRSEPSLGLSAGSCGFALRSPAPLEARRMTVFYQCVQRTAAETRLPTGVVLAHLAAHELGHLLLPERRHASAGMMRARFTSRDWEKASLGQLRFTGEEEQHLRAAIAARLRPPEAYEVAARGRE